MKVRGGWRGKRGRGEGAVGESHPGPRLQGRQAQCTLTEYHVQSERMSAGSEGAVWLSSGRVELGADEVADGAGVGFAAGDSHDLAHEEL